MGDLSTLCCTVSVHFTLPLPKIGRLQPQRGSTDQQTPFLPSRPSLDCRPAAWEDQDVSLPTFFMDDFDIGTNHDWILPADAVIAEKVSHDILKGKFHLDDSP